jgi:polysaccharide biosynthesis protein PslA
MIRDVRSRDFYELSSNRVLNIAVAALLLLIIGPLLIFVALIIRWESRGPALERRLSISRDGGRFREMNFRVTEDDSSGVAWPRNITRVGWFLLYTRIVSLPLLLNVLRGDMTLIEMRDYSSLFWE